MLKYREYLNESRARRGILKFPVHYQLPQQYYIKAKTSKNKNTNKFKITSEYGLLRYSKGNINKNHKSNQFQQTSLKDQSKRHGQIKEYVILSQEKNVMIKSKLSQMKSSEQTQKSLLNSIKNIDNKQINPPPKHIKQFSFCRNNDEQKQKSIIQHVQSSQSPQALLSIPKSTENYACKVYDEQINYSQNKPKYQNSSGYYFTNHKNYQIQHKNKHSLHYHPFYKNKQHNNKNQTEKLYIKKNKYQTHQFQQDYPITQSNPNLSQQPITIVPKDNFSYRQTLPTYTRRPTFQKLGNSPLQKGSSQNMWALTKQKLNKLKYDDEQLRASTIQLINKHIN